MGFRFRKSVKIAPGVKLNLSKSGGSLSLGGRGATVNISNRGVRSTYSLPGTGISYVTQTSSDRNTRSSSSYSSNRSAYKELLRQQKEEEKQSLLREAEEGYHLFQEKIDSLANILKNREKQSFDWENLIIPRGEYKPEAYKLSSFSEPENTLLKETLRQEIRNKNSGFYITYFLVGLGFILLLQSFWAALAVLVLATVSYVFERNRLDKLCNRRLQARLQEENDKFNRNRQRAYKDYTAKIELEKAEHEKAERGKKQTWDGEEQHRERLRNSINLQDPEPLAELLEIELSNEDLPVPLVFDIEFMNVNLVAIFMEIPELDVVPEEKINLTKTGKLSARKMVQKDRFKLYSDICTGLTLRLIYETFRVIHSVDTVELHGLTEQVNPSNGHSENITSLHIRTSRQDFGQLNLDSLDPTSAFTSLKGKFACNKKGKLSPLKAL
ncbi:MAG: hypothetical protein DCF15_11460 [Phormidesmis priestleyi]|uniref:DUF4236 domain-containing protein n=1 Tax=Phormidesmis priestleyi TaxID=268141 RepID=A0A2W4XFL5_9CYAN|nr:MAG: hypothetical protein DCF15_11460 [Phormidesmis priestleyi]